MSEPKAKMIYLHALTPVHSGTGQAAAVIDLPIAREKATGWPMIPASSLKGVLRDAYERQNGETQAKAIFGDADKAGALVFGDQRILCLPVRSYFGTFAYVTCPLVLERLKRDAEAIGITPLFDEVPKVQDTPPSSPGANDGKLNVLLAESGTLDRDNTVYLEDLNLTAEANDTTKQIAEAIANTLFNQQQKAFVSRFAIVSDEVFNFLSETATEVVARVALEDETKTVRSGGLWYEEAVPAETIFAGPVMIADHYRRNDVNNLWATLQVELIQIGGDASVGRGLCRVVIV